MKTLKFLAAVILTLTVATQTIAQEKLFTRNGHINFFSKAPLENIEADNKQVTSFLDMNSGEMVFAVLMKSFTFEKALMQEHFNENYVESDKFPKATYKGKVINISEVDFKKDGTYPVTVEGELTLHGVTKPLNHEGILEIKGNNVIGKSLFPLTLADYDIAIPAMVKDNIAKTVDVTVEMNYQPFQQ